MRRRRFFCHSEAEGPKNLRGAHSCRFKILRCAQDDSFSDHLAQVRHRSGCLCAGQACHSEAEGPKNLVGIHFPPAHFVRLLRAAAYPRLPKNWTFFGKKELDRAFAPNARSILVKEEDTT